MTPEAFVIWRSLGFRDALVVLPPGSDWCVICPSCALVRDEPGPTLARWMAETHNESPAHKLAVLL